MGAATCGMVIVVGHTEDAYIIVPAQAPYVKSTRPLQAAAVANYRIAPC